MGEGPQEHEQVKLYLDEWRGRAHVRWKATDSGGTVIADLRQDLGAGGAYDSGVLVDAIAEHYGVDHHAVRYGRRKPGSTRFVPGQATVTLPPKPVAEPTCVHLVDEQACGLRTCHGTPPMSTVIDRNVLPVDPNGPYEYGQMIEAREVMDRVARQTGMTVTGGHVGDNGWSERRVREINGYWFTADSYPVKVLTFEARENGAQQPGTYTVVYVGHLDGVMALRQRYARQGEVVVALVDTLDRLVDERTLANTDGGWIALKNPPVGWQVRTDEHGIVTVTEASTNDGYTLRATDSVGVFRYIDRPIGNSLTPRWTCAPAGAQEQDDPGALWADALGIGG